jgi:hypothetical protein
MTPQAEAYHRDDSENSCRIPISSLEALHIPVRRSLKLHTLFPHRLRKNPSCGERLRGVQGSRLADETSN